MPVGFDGPTGTVVPHLAFALPPLLVAVVGADDDDDEEEHAAVTAATSAAPASMVHVRLPLGHSPLLRPFIGHSPRSRLVLVSAGDVANRCGASPLAPRDGRS